ncbi:DUF3311 domain-containing protein [Streptomyces sp. NPDC058424]|uniref:DUF3311 domain-containing protein n=1 Tax=Streptomyces sp. NPDC058424 TaxID=3346491 RepID=UPI0036509B30
MADRTAAARRSCLAAVFIGPLLAPLYMRTEPRLLGWPFFYWYQFAWVLLVVALLLGALAFRRVGRKQDALRERGTEQDRTSPVNQ